MQFKHILNYKKFGQKCIQALLKSNKIKITNETEAFKLVFNVADQVDNYKEDIEQIKKM